MGHARNDLTSCSNRAIGSVARRGFLEIAQFIVTNRSEDWTDSALNDAIYSGYDEILGL